jgi:hypothetical protein
LYGCETWSDILRKEHILKDVENRVLRRIFGLKREEVAGGWTKLYREEFHNVYTLPHIIRVIKSNGIGWMGM